MPTGSLKLEPWSRAGSNIEEAAPVAAAAVYSGRALTTTAPPSGLRFQHVAGAFLTLNMRTALRVSASDIEEVSRPLDNTDASVNAATCTDQNIPRVGTA